jgi:hypothetical protein
VHLAGLNHFHLLNHARVYEHLERFLSRASAPRGRRALAAGSPSDAETPPDR